MTTLVFLMVILAVTDERNEHPALAPLAIGLSLAMIHFTTIPLTGTSVNPARSIGPALFAGGDAIAQQWLFIVAPLLGGALAGLLYPLVFGRHGEPVAGSGLRFDAVRSPARSLATVPRTPTSSSGTSSTAPRNRASPVQLPGRPRLPSSGSSRSLPPPHPHSRGPAHPAGPAVARRRRRRPDAGPAAHPVTRPGGRAERIRSSR